MELRYDVDHLAVKCAIDMEFFNAEYVPKFSRPLCISKIHLFGVFLDISILAMLPHLEARELVHLEQWYS